MLMLEEEGFEHEGQGAVLTLCAWCGRIKTSGGEWETIPDVQLDANTSHGICLECIASEMCAARQN